MPSTPPSSPSSPGASSRHYHQHGKSFKMLVVFGLLVVIALVSLRQSFEISYSTYGRLQEQALDALPTSITKQMKGLTNNENKKVLKAVENVENRVTDKEATTEKSDTGKQMKKGLNGLSIKNKTVLEVVENVEKLATDKEETTTTKSATNEQMKKGLTGSSNENKAVLEAVKTAKKMVTDKGKTKEKSENTDEPLNIMLFYADDWTMKTLGALNPLIKTPHIDALANDGMLFTNNCVTTSICWVSRATLVTGQYASRHQQLRISDEHMFKDWNNTLFPQLKNDGYYTGLVGKWHAPQPPEKMKQAFDMNRFYYGDHFFPRRGKPMHVTAMNEEDALDFLRNRPRDKKFFLSVNFFATHAVDGEPFPNQFQPMNSSMEWYKDDDIPNAKTNTQQHWEDLPWFFDDRNEGRNRWRDRFDTPERYNVSIRNLFRLATEVDAACGAVIQELKDQGMYDKTLIVFTTDNGYFQGDHGMSDKWYAFEESIKVPLVIRDPRMPAHMRGKHNSEYTLSIDLAPTLLSAAKIPVPMTMQGKNIASLYMDPEKASESWRKDFFYEFHQGSLDGVDHELPQWWIPAVFAYIEKEYKYMYWPQTKYEQLFNFVDDPYEEIDIFNTTTQTNKEILDALKERFTFLKNRAQHGHSV